MTSAPSAHARAEGAEPAGPEQPAGVQLVEEVLEQLPTSIAAELRSRHLDELTAAVGTLGRAPTVDALTPADVVRSPRGWTRVAVADLTAQASEQRRRATRNGRSRRDAASCTACGGRGWLIDETVAGSDIEAQPCPHCHPTGGRAA